METTPPENLEYDIGIDENLTGETCVQQTRRESSKIFESTKGALITKEDLKRWDEESAQTKADVDIFGEPIHSQNVNE